MDGPEVQIVSYGEPRALAPALDSLRAQTLPPVRIRVWHNGPRFGPGDEPPDTEWRTSGANLGFGAAHNRLFETAGADVVVIANPDLVFDRHCLERIGDELARYPEAVIVAPALVTAEDPPRVNAFGLRLAADLLGLNPDRGRALSSLCTSPERPGDDRRYLGPSGALFAVHRGRLRARIAGPLFAESLFLYQEDVALWLRLRAAGVGFRFRPDSWARHAFSGSVGPRSPLKLYHVERNRLWLLRALGGRAEALARLPFTALRYGAYLASAPRQAPRGLDAPLLRALAQGIRDGLHAPLPDELQAYLAGARASRPDRAFGAELRAQLTDPTRP